MSYFPFEYQFNQMIYPYGQAMENIYYFPYV